MDNKKYVELSATCTLDSLLELVPGDGMSMETAPAHLVFDVNDLSEDKLITLKDLEGMI